MSTLTPSKQEAFEHIEGPHAHTVEDYNRNINARFVMIMSSPCFWSLTDFRVINPLRGISKSDLLTQVSSFCADHGLEDKELIFQKGALVAQYPQDFEDIAELDEDDKYHLRREVTSMFTRKKAGES